MLCLNMHNRYWYVIFEFIQRASPACSASFRPSQQGPAPHIFFSPDFGEFFKLAPRAVITYYHHARKSVRSKPLSIVTWRHSIHIWLFMIRWASSLFALRKFIIYWICSLCLVVAHAIHLTLPFYLLMCYVKYFYPVRLLSLQITLILVQW